MAGQGQTLPFVQGYVTWQLLEGRPHVDGQADVLSHRACCIGSHARKCTSVPWLCEESNQNRFLCPDIDRHVVHNAVKDVGCAQAYLSPLDNKLS